MVLSASSCPMKCCVSPWPLHRETLSGDGELLSQILGLQNYEKSIQMAAEVVQTAYTIASCILGHLFCIGSLRISAGQCSSHIVRWRYSLCSLVCLTYGDSVGIIIRKYLNFLASAQHLNAQACRRQRRSEVGAFVHLPETWHKFHATLEAAESTTPSPAKDKVESFSLHFRRPKVAAEYK